MDSLSLDILTYPDFRRSTDNLLSILSEADLKKDGPAITSAAKGWLRSYKAAMEFIYDAPFTYTNMYLVAVRKAFEKGELNENLLKEAFSLWVNALYLFQKSYNNEDT